MTIKNAIAELFGQSPIRPIQEHMRVSSQAADKLLDFYDRVVVGDWELANRIFNDVSDLDHKASQLKRDMRLHLPKSLFLPVPRGDLLSLISMQGKIAHTVKDIASLVLNREMSFPEPLQAPFRSLIQTAIANVHQALKAINELDELLESGFSGRELEIVENLVDELNRLEREADQQAMTLRSDVFALESTLPPVDVMFLYRTIDGVSYLAHRSQKIGDRLLILIAR